MVSRRRSNRGGCRTLLGWRLGRGHPDALGPPLRARVIGADESGPAGAHGLGRAQRGTVEAGGEQAVLNDVSLDVRPGGNPRGGGALQGGRE